MAKRKARARHETTPRVNDSGHTRLAQLLEGVNLARLVPQLAPETLHQIIRHRGLDACADLIASTTPAQLTTVLDLDLWGHAQPGRDERFDEDRFGEWIELLVDGGASAAARTVAAIDPALVISGLARYVRVTDPAAVGPELSGDDEVSTADGMVSTGVACEVGGYLVRSRRTDAWDALVALLLALDTDHRDYFHTVMRGCRRLSNSTPEPSGFDDLLLEREQLLHDVALQREHRRTRQGYLTPSDARAYLQMARQPRRQAPDGSLPVNPIAAAYLRAADDAVAPPDAASPSPDAAGRSLPGDISKSIDAVVELLAEAGVVPGRPRGLLEGAAPGMPPLADIRRLMEHSGGTDDAAYETRSRELAFLANALMAGCSVQSRPFTPQEASDAAASICNLGLERRRLHRPGALEDRDLLSAFELGWAALHQDVGMVVADRLIAVLGDLRCSAVDTQRGIYVLRRELMRQRDAGAPWRARTALEVIAMLDAPSWASLLGLLDECPVLPAALRATLEGHAGAISATEFEFIATQAQIEEVLAFVKRLPELLLR